MSELITLRHTLAPGDILVMTALVRDLALAYPGRYRVRVSTPHKDVWKHNPYVEKGTEEGKQIRLDYGRYIREANRRPIHFLTGFHQSFEHLTGVKVPLTEPYPDLHMADKLPRQVEGRYWVVLSGGKTDFTTKHWAYGRHQQVADALRGFGLKVVQAGAAEKSQNHRHPKLTGVVDLLGKTDLRQLFHLIQHSEGVVCTITLAMHAAAALGKPCVVTAGGREHWWWEGYHRDNPGLAPVGHRLKVNHRFLHTMGMLPCCFSAPCWLNKSEKTSKDKSVCKDSSVTASGQHLPKCQDMITTEKVIEACLSYYLDGTLEPTPEMRSLFFSPQAPARVSLPVLERIV